MNKLIDKILLEWSYRVHDGMPNPKNPLHLIHLQETLNELRLPRKVSEKLLQNLRAVEEEFNAIKKDTGNTSSFKTKDTRDAAVKRGTHDMVKDKDPDDGSTEKEEPKVGQTTKLEKTKEEEKDKTLKEDIDYSGEDTPEHITAENKISDEEFEEKKKRGKIKEQKYKNKTIEVNGKTYNQPLTYEEVKSFFPSPPYKFPEKYIKTLHRILNTQKKSKTQPSITEFVDGVGAGEIPSQSAELLTMMTSTMSNEESAEFFDIVGATIENQTGKQILDSVWINAAKSSRDTIERQVKEQFGEDAEIEFGGWDTQKDVEEGIGMSNRAKNKGHSTDAFFRVKTPEGPKLYESSLKKDLKAYWASLGASKVEKKMEAAGVNLYDSEDERLRDSPQLLMKNQVKHSKNRFKEMNQEQMDKIADKSDEEILNDALNLPDKPTDIRGKVLSGQKGQKELSPKAIKMLKFIRKMKEDGNPYPLPWDEKTFEDPEFQKYVEKNFGKSITTQDGFMRVATMMNYLAYSQEISEGTERGPAWEYLDTTKGMEKKEDGKFKPGSGKYVSNKFILKLGKKEAAKVVMEILKENFPLKSLMEGEESIAAGSISVDSESLKEIFGTDNYDEIQEHIKTVEDPETGEVSLVYTGGVDGKEIKLGKVECRQRGDTAPTIGILPHPSFQHRLYCQSQKKGTELNKEEATIFSGLVNKYGKCGEAKY